MKKYLILTQTFLFVFCLIEFAHTQKTAHLNSVMLMDSLPEAKKLAVQIKTYEDALVKTGEEMIAKFQANAQKYQQGVQAGNLTAIQQKEMETNLETEQTAIDNYRKSAEESLVNRKKEIVQPLLDKINLTLKEIGKENNYDFIFDSSVNLLFATESEDIFSLVYKRLNP